MYVSCEKALSGMRRDPMILCWIHLTLGVLAFVDPASGQNVVVQQPTFGVSIDAQGVLRSKEFPGGPNLILRRMAAAKANLGADLFKASKLRFVSLKQLDNAIKRRLKAGQQPTEVMRKLAGLLRVEYVFVFPEQKDIVLGGPAEGWIESPSGHAVGVTSGLPVLLLQDLTAALQVFSADRPANQWVGCTIGPSAEAVRKLQAFNRTIPRAVSQGQEAIYAEKILQGTIDSLGMAGVATFGIKSDSNMGLRMIEADYRMKMIGIGIERPPVPLKTFFSEIKAPPTSVLQRWWLVPDYQRIGIAKDRLSARLIGAGIQLLTENYDRDGKGGLKPSKRKPSAASQAYARSFTENFERIAQLSSSFGHLRNTVDLLVAAAFLRSEKIFQRLNWSPGWISNQQIEYERTPAVRHAPCLIQSKWHKRRFFTLAGGGVSIVPAEALLDKNLLSLKEPEILAKRPQKRNAENWWWDER